MAKILVNYIYNKTMDEFKILSADCVYADQKVAVLETEDEIDKPLVVPIRGMMTVVDRNSYEANNKKYFLSADEKGNVYEDKNGTPIWLPKDTDLSKLKIMNGQLVKVPDEEPVKEPKPKKPKANKEA